MQSYTLLDGSQIRTPGVGVYTSAGENMENYGVQPDYVVDSGTADFLAGRDRQTEKAMEVLRGQSGEPGMVEQRLPSRSRCSRSTQTPRLRPTAHGRSELFHFDIHRRLWRCEQVSWFTFAIARRCRSRFLPFVISSEFCDSR
jgi:hypothetical protein